MVYNNVAAISITLFQKKNNTLDFSS